MKEVKISFNKYGKLLPFLLLLALGIGIYFFPGKYNKVTEKTETVKVLGIQRPIYYLTFEVAENLGFFQEQKLKVETTTRTTEEALIPALLAGQADIALVNLEKAIYARVENKPIVIFAALTAKNNSFLLSRSNISSFSWSSLKGKTIITASPEDQETVLLKSILRKNNLDLYREVTLFTNIPTSLSIEAFLAGTGDFILTAEPEASLIENKGAGKVIASLGQEGGNFPAQVFVTRSDFAQGHAQALLRFTKVLHQTQLWLKTSSPNTIISLLPPTFYQQQKINRQDLSKILKRHLGQNIWADSPFIKPEQYDYFIHLLMEAKEIARPVAYKKIINSSFYSMP
ncbi:MAG TPA: hypothetical protein DCK87_05700 [Desulfotomaculum sp.]|nr:hypothetical protein [Desulfotomaculum sp.]